MEVSIHELLAAAREAVKSDYIKGESILCETRYHPDTHYMVEIEMLKTDNTLGEKGAAYSAKTEHSLRMSGALFR